MREIRTKDGRVIVSSQNEKETLKQMVGQANLSGIDLSQAMLSDADLSQAELYRSNLNGVDLTGANLMRAKLAEANLIGACLVRANLRWADLRGANLYRANLCYADLSGAYLGGANLRKANLSRSNLYDSDLTEADLGLGEGYEAAILPTFWIIPQEGAFIAWKSVPNYIIKLEIPAAARRTSSLVGRKCRAEFARVLEIFNRDDGNVAPDDTQGYSWWQRRTVYKRGDMIYPDSFNDDIRLECTNGIHFFTTRKEAEGFNPWSHHNN